MSLITGYVGARIIEGFENIEKSDQSEIKPNEAKDGNQAQNEFYSNENFWSQMQSSPDSILNKEVKLIQPVLSEWIARVPGLFYAKGSQNMRVAIDRYEDSIDSLGQSIVTYDPSTKSSKVLGGLGTIKLPPDASGFKIATLSIGYNNNASSGIPVLIHPDVWDAQNLEEGLLIKEITGVWKEMTTEWASRFPILKNIRKGALVLDNPDQKIEVVEKNVMIRTSPFAIMEYTNTETGIKLFDYVFASASPSDKNFRKHIENFFAKYKTRNNRVGKYLTTADISNPMWDAEYNTPQDLRRLDPSGESHLNLVTERVRESMFNENTIEEILAITIDKYDSKESIFTLAQDIGLKKAIWYNGGALTDVGADFINASLEYNKIEELIDAIALEYPRIIGN